MLGSPLFHFMSRDMTEFVQVTSAMGNTGIYVTPHCSFSPFKGKQAEPEKKGLAASPLSGASKKMDPLALL